MNLTITGCKAADITLPLGPKTVLIGPSATGKSSCCDSLRWIFAGFVPILGKRLQDSAQLMRGREMTAQLTLDDGRWVRRELYRTTKGALTQRCEVSWLDPNSTQEEHEVALGQLVGGSTQDVIEALDLRELLKLTGAPRAARLQALMESRTDPTETLRAVLRATLVKLSGIPADHAPADYDDLRDTAQKMIPVAVYEHLKAAAGPLQGKLAESLTAAAAWVNDRKRFLAADLTKKRAARTELQPRHDALGPEIPGEYERLDARRSELDRDIGAWQERASAVEAARQKIAEAARELTTAETELRAAEEQRAAAVEAAKGLPLMREQLGRLDAELTGLQAPAAPDLTDLDGLEARASEADRMADAIVLPEVPDAAAAESRVAALRQQIAAAETDPWREVDARARKIHALVQRGGKGRPQMVADISAHVETLLHLAREGMAMDLDDLQRQLADAETVAADARTGADVQRIERAQLAQDREGLRSKAADLRTQARTERANRSQAHQTALQAYQRRLGDLRTQAATLAHSIEALEARDRRTQQALTDVTAAVTAWRRRLDDLGPAPDAVEAQNLDAELGQVQTALSGMARARALRQEFATLLEQIEAAESEHAVFVALEEAVKRVRALEAQAGASPLLTTMVQFLSAAGRPEVPFVEVVGAEARFGWRDTQARSIAISTLSGDEFLLYVAALACALLKVRNAPIRPLLLEAKELDAANFAALLRGIEAVEDAVTHAIVVRGEQAMEARAGWTLVALGNGRAERAA